MNPQLKIQCEPDLVGKVVGKNGKHINKIKSEVKCKGLTIQHYQTSDDAYFYITYPYSCKNNALFAANIMRNHVAATKLIVDGIKIPCGKNLVGKIVGKRWCNIKQIKKETNVDDIKYNEGELYFHVTGFRTNSLRAVELLNKRIAKAKAHLASQPFLKNDSFGANVDRLRQRNVEDTMPEDEKIKVLCEENLVSRIVGQKWKNIQRIKKKCHVKDIRYNDELFYFHIIVANSNRLQKHVALKNANKAAEMLKKQIAQVKKAIRDAKKREKDERKKAALSAKNKKKGENSMTKSYSSTSLSTISSTESNSDQSV